MKASTGLRNKNVVLKAVKLTATSATLLITRISIQKTLTSIKKNTAIKAVLLLGNRAEYSGHEANDSAP